MIRLLRRIRLSLRKIAHSPSEVVRAEWRFDLGYSGCEICRSCDDKTVSSCRVCNGKAWLFWHLENGKRVYH